MKSPSLSHTIPKEGGMDMSPAQEEFQSFILARVATGKENEAKSLLDESFKKKEQNAFDLTYMKNFAPKMAALLKPEYVDEVTTIMNQYNT